jgi:bifunctional UDP-N-acetylglucosamine pyrophosphorylase/glucosamine-1-phosphate N-acetyltransferase
MPLDVIVLAAGEGKRMRSTLPKVLHPLAGRPLLAHVLDAAQALKPRQIFVVHGHGAAQVRAAFKQARVTWVEQPRRLGTGHAVMQALPKVRRGADVLVLNGDVPLVRPETLKRLAAAAKSGLALCTSELADATGYGRVVRDAKRRVRSIVEQADARASSPSASGTPAAAPAASCPPTPGENRTSRRSTTYRCDRGCGESGRGDATVQPEDRGRWRASIRGMNSPRWNVPSRTRAKECLSPALRPADYGASTCARIVCGRASRSTSTAYSRARWLGDRADQPPVLRDDRRRRYGNRAFSLFDRATVGEALHRRPLRACAPAALAEDGTSATSSKRRQPPRRRPDQPLTYIGDAAVGARATSAPHHYPQLAREHRTVIEDDSFIGSDATLVAQVTIAKGSYIGAGSTISKNTPPGQLTVARARQISLPGWKPSRKK